MRLRLRCDVTLLSNDSKIFCAKILHASLMNNPTAAEHVLCPQQYFQIALYYQTKVVNHKTEFYGKQRK